MDECTKTSTTIVVEFMAENGPSIHEAVGVDSNFNIESCQYELKFETSELKETVRRCALETKLDVDHEHCTWEQVEKAWSLASDAREDSKTRGDRFWSKYWRQLGQKGVVIAPVLQAIPDEYSPLHGGLALIFSLARHREDCRQKILTAFQDIPDIIEMAQRRSDTFQHDPELMRRVERLKLTLVKTLPLLIDILCPGSFLKKSASPFKALEITELLDAIRKGADSVCACAESLRDDFIVGNFQRSESILEGTTEMRHEVHDIGKRISHVSTGVWGLSDQCQEIESIVTQIRRQHESLLDAISSQNGLYQFLKDEVFKHSHENDTNASFGRSWSFSQPPPSPAPQITLTQLLRGLRVPDPQASNDLGYVLKQASGFEGGAQSHADAVLKYQQFRHWLSARESGLLHVDGHMHSPGKTSQMSYFCANLAQVLRVAETNSVLHVFCGQHVAADDALRGPSGLIRSLVAQLVVEMLRRGSIDQAPESLTVPEPSDDSSVPQTQQLCHTFHQLLREVPANASVFVLLDGISWFEREAWAPAYTAVMGMLREVLADECVVARFKVLMTSPKRSIWQRGHLVEAEHIELSENAHLPAGSESRLWRAAMAVIRAG